MAEVCENAVKFLVKYPDDPVVFLVKYWERPVTVRPRSRIPRSRSGPDQGSNIHGQAPGQGSEFHGQATVSSPTVTVKVMVKNPLVTVRAVVKNPTVTVRTKLATPLRRWSNTVVLSCPGSTKRGPSVDRSKWRARTH